MSLSQISFAVPTSQYEALRQRAGVLNIKPSEYAKRLYDAAYYVRCMAEKGEPAADQALDRQVRQVFMLADCQPEYIAQAIGMPVALAQKILDGWRQAAGEAHHEIASSDGGAFAEVTGTAQLADADSVEPSPSVPPPCPFRRPRSPIRQGVAAGNRRSCISSVGRRQDSRRDRGCDRKETWRGRNVRQQEPADLPEAQEGLMP